MRRDSQEIGVECAEPHLSQDEGEVVLGWIWWDISGQADQVERPQVIVLEAFPQTPGSNRLPVVHVAFRWVVAK